jgi:hypothetical protein
MKEEQKAIYYAAGESIDKIEMLPQVETFKSRGYEILYLTDDVDEFALRVLEKYADKEFKNVTSEAQDFATEEEKEALKKEFEEKTKKLRDETNKKINNAGLGEDYQKEISKITTDSYEKTSKELDSFMEKTKGMKTDSDEYKALHKEYKDKVAKIEKERDDAIDDAAERAWEKKKAQSNEVTTGDKKPEDYTNEEIEALQDETSNEEDENKRKEKEDLLKSICKAKDLNSDEIVPKVVTGKDGKTYQKKVGPRGGKYYRSKGDNGWSDWQNGVIPESLSSHIVNLTNNHNWITKINTYLFNN